ncbi:hypothetical protein [Negativibacillus massiliensis]|uniref:hypothetical protein n=1 Tax=Negativibacillus massiliensis TaxID=1871035 RepID=UPI003AF7FE62
MKIEKEMLCSEPVCYTEKMRNGKGVYILSGITEPYRLLKYGKMNRVLFLVDTKSLGEQAERKYTKMIPVLFLSFMECVG